MKPRKNQIKFVLLAIVLCLPLVLFNSCQSSEDEIIFSSEKLLNKDSKIVSLLLKAVGASTGEVSSKSTDDDQQCTEFVYPITFYAYTSDATEPAAVIIESNEELVAFLTALTNGDEFFITYPVTLIDVDGNQTVINDYPDLEGILIMLVDACTGGDDGDNDDGDDSDGDDDDSDGDDDDNDDDSDEVEYEYCGNGNNPNKKVVICHNGQTICISINAIWGHMAHHEDDYFGSCNN